MMRKFSVFVLIGFLFMGFLSTAQESMKGEWIYCPYDPDNTDHSHIPLSNKVRKALEARGRSANTGAADIQVTYTGFTQEAQDAFQFAVDIWSTLLKSDVTIYVDAQFVSFSDPNTIGGASPSTLYRGFEGAHDTTTWYVVPLAEKMARMDLNEPGEADINASFSSDFDFYFGTDGNPPSNQTDFVSIVLHELCHGLGFFNFTDVTSGVGTYGSSNIPAVYSTYIEDGNGISIFDVDNGSMSMANFFQNNDLFLDAPLATSGNGDVKPKIYAPATYGPGSSIAHLDEALYPPGDINTLMTPFVGDGQASLDPGPITLNLFADMGWVHSWIIHEEKFAFTNLTDDLVFEVTVKSDTTLATSDVTMHYSFDGFATESSIVMTASGDMRTATITNPGTTAFIEYYFDGVTDDLGRSYRAPSFGAFQERYLSVIGDFTQVLGPTLHDFDGASTTYRAVNLTGTPIELGSSSIAGKDGTTSGSNAWVTGLTDAQYENNSQAILLSPFYDFTILGEYSFSFNTKYSFEATWDGFIVQYSTDSGVSWTTLRNEVSASDWYNQLSNALSIFGPSTPIFSGNTGGNFLSKNADVSFLAGNPKVWFRFVFLTDITEVDVGMAIDDVELAGPAPGTVVAAFDANNLEGCVGHTVTFSNQSTGSVEELLWDFGQGADPATASGVGPHTVTFGTAGTSTVVLTANGNGEQSIEQITITTGAEHTPTVTSVENADGTVTLTASAGDAYQWLEDGSEVSGETSQTITVDNNSDYSVVVTVEGCEGTSEPLQYILGLDDAKELTVYPNPTTGVINLSFDGEVSLVNTTGQTVMKAVIPKDSKQLDLSSVPSGIYFIKNKERSVRVIKSDKE